MTAPATMKAMVLTGHGDLDKYEWHTDWPTPTPGPTEVLIKVGACGLNNTDVNTRTGWYSKAVDERTTGGAFEEIDDEDSTWGGAPLTFPRIQGADAVGVVVAVGEAADPALIGKRVMVAGWLRDWDDPLNRDKAGYFGSECNGGFAEYTTADMRGIATIESEMSDAELATFSCSYVTAEGMVERANVGADDTVLIPGASGGVGGALIQLCKLRGARVIAMASEAKHDDVAQLGPYRILPRAPDNLKAALKGEKITVVADIVGGDQWGKLIDVLERGGRYTCSGAIAGPIVDFDLRTFYLRDLTFTGSTVNPPEDFHRVAKYIEAGQLKPALAATYPLEQLREAQQAFIDKKHTGNIVVTP